MSAVTEPQAAVTDVLDEELLGATTKEAEDTRARRVAKAIAMLRGDA
jgi:hypothetical protein